MKFIGCKVPAEVHEAFAVAAQTEHRTISGELRHLIDERLKRDQPEAEAA